MTQPLKFFQNFGILTMHLVLHVEFLAPSIYFSTYSYCVYYIPSIFLGSEYSEVNKTWSFIIAKKKKKSSAYLKLLCYLLGGYTVCIKGKLVMRKGK